MCEFTARQTAASNALLAAAKKGGQDVLFVPTNGSSASGGGLQAGDLLLLSAGDEWFNGSVIDTALAHLQQFASQQPGLAPVACFPSQYPTHVSLEDTQHKTSMDAAKTWPRPVDDLAACQHLVFPINHSTLPPQQKHWTVLIVTPLSSSITFVDSYHALPGLRRRCPRGSAGCY